MRKKKEKRLKAERRGRGEERRGEVESKLNLTGDENTVRAHRREQKKEKIEKSRIEKTRRKRPVMCRAAGR